MSRDNFSDLEDTHYGCCNKSDVETKIYPLAKFAYSFQRRFHELASPVEAFHFKLPSIDRSEWQAKLNPTNEWQCFYAKSIHALLYDGENDYVDIWEDGYADSDYHYQRKVNDVAHYMVDDKLTLRNVNSTAAANNIFKRICHMPCDIILENCTIDNKLLPCMANSNKLSWNWHYITFKSCRFKTSSIIDNIYKNRVPFNRLRFENCKDFDWISDLLRAERNNLQLLSIFGDIDDVFLNATEADFAKIFTPGKYDENLRICLRFPKSTWSVIEAKVMSILGNNFWQGGDNADLTILCENDVRRFNFKSLKWKLDQIKVSFSKQTIACVRGCIDRANKFRPPLAHRRLTVAYCPTVFTWPAAAATYIGKIRRRRSQLAHHQLTRGQLTIGFLRADSGTVPAHCRRSCTATDTTTMVNSLFSSKKKYDLAKFCDSFQTRLRELATPKEAYNFQLADIDGTVNLGPRVNFCPVSTIIYDNKLNKVSVRKTKSSEPVEVEDNAIYDVKDSIEVHHATTSFFGSTAFHQVYSVPKLLKLINCTVDSSLTTALLTVWRPVEKEFKIMWLSHPDECKLPGYNPDRYYACHGCRQRIKKENCKIDNGILTRFRKKECLHKALNDDKPTPSKATASKKTPVMNVAKNLFLKLSHFTDSKGKGF